jgi:hypothetical protein
MKNIYQVIVAICFNSEYSFIGIFMLDMLDDHKMEKNQCNRKCKCGYKQERFIMHGYALFAYFILGDTWRLSV